MWRKVSVSACLSLVIAPTAEAVAAPLLEDNTAILDVPGRPDVLAEGWKDSYSVGDSCYCITTFDHNIGPVEVETPLGTMTVREVCELLGPGPGRADRPVYNDVQCGNGPPNDHGDEVPCPGRVDHGQEGCGYIGPKWNFEPFLENGPPPARVPANAPVPSPPASAPPVAPPPPASPPASPPVAAPPPVTVPCKGAGETCAVPSECCGRVCVGTCAARREEGPAPIAQPAPVAAPSSVPPPPPPPPHAAIAAPVSPPVATPVASPTASSLPGSSCREAGETCTAPSDCCSKLCLVLSGGGNGQCAKRK